MNKILFFTMLFFVISCRKDETKILSFKDCKVEYVSYGSGEKELYAGHNIPNRWELESAKRKLALCLCAKYLQKPDIEIKDKIMEIYQSKEQYFENPKNLNFDTILKRKTEIFDPTIYLD